MLRLVRLRPPNKTMRNSIVLRNAGQKPPPEAPLEGSCCQSGKNIFDFDNDITVIKMTG